MLGQNNHAVCVSHERRTYDQLKWPFQGVVTVQLVNQKRDQRHVEDTIDFDRVSAARVTYGEKDIGLGSPILISHTTVEFTTLYMSTMTV